MANGLTIEVSGLGAAVRGLYGLRDADRRTLFTRLGALEQELTRSRLDRLLSNRDQRFPPSKTTRSGKASTTLLDTGNMMKAFGPQIVTKDFVTMGLSGLEAHNKAKWAQWGTRKHRIEPRVKKALSFPSTGGIGSFSNSVRIGSKDSRKGQQFFSVLGFSRKSAGRRVVTGMTTVRGVNHPGTPPRPLFGVSPKDALALVDRVKSFYIEAAKRAGLKIG